MTLPAPTRRGMTPAVVVMVLTLLLGLQPVTTDLYLPSLPTIQRDFGASTGSVQLTLSALIICFGLGQLAWGPLSDRFGRRPVLLAGMAMYTLASVGSALAPGIDALIAWRAVQGAALAAAVTCGRSIVRDLFQPHEGARVMSRALGGLGVIAMLSPLLGGVLAQWRGWHASLLALTLFGAGVAVFIALRFEETLAMFNPHATRLAPMWRNWKAVLGSRAFRAWVALLCFTWGGMFFTLAGSSFVLINMRGVSRVAFGVILASNSLAYIAGTVLCRRLLTRHGTRGAVKRGAWLSLSGGVSIAGLSLLGAHSVWAIVLPQYLFALGHGIHQPCGQVGAVGPFPDKAGTAASLSGFAMMVTAFGVGLWLGHALTDSALPMTLGIGVFGIGVAAVAWTWVQRDGEPAAARAPGAPATLVGPASS